MASEKVNLRDNSIKDIVAQAIELKAGTGSPQNVWIDEFTNCYGEQTKRQVRAAEDASAIGGLRSPHKAVAGWPSAPSHSLWPRHLIDGLPGVDMPEVDAALATLGQEDIPQPLLKLASAMRRKLCDEVGVVAQESVGLQGKLIDSLASHFQDLDGLVRQWLRDEAVPLGIDKSIEPGGVFPLADMNAMDVDVDTWSEMNNYSSYEQYQEGAEEILLRALHK